MDIDDIIKILSERDDMVEELIYWLSDRGYLDDYKIQGVRYDDDYDY